jgi:hypothetical protein
MSIFDKYLQIYLSFIDWFHQNLLKSFHFQKLRKFPKNQIRQVNFAFRYKRLSSGSDLISFVSGRRLSNNFSPIYTKILKSEFCFQI